MKYMVAAPDLSGSEAAYVAECLRTNWISSKGRFIGEFEAAFARFVGCKHAVACCNGTAAMHAALLAAGLGPGDEVIVPSLTYVASANAVTYCGATPVFADSRPDTWCVDPDSVARLVTPRTKGIIPVHLYGHPCDMRPLLETARRHGLWVVEDCAEAQGATYEGRMVGTFGAVAAFSFFGNKIISTGEGGMMTTDDDALAERLRLLRGQGMDPARRYWHPTLGYNYRMTNIEAAIGLAQMERVDELVGARQRVARWYRERLGRLPGLTHPAEAPPATNVFWLYSVLAESRARRDELMAGLEEAGVETRPFFYAAHHFPMYAGARTDRGCPVACDLSSRGINLPTSAYLKEEDVDWIARAVAELVRGRDAGAARRAA
jgi:perosamine synthetase